MRVAFLAYLSILAVEYLGLSYQFPILKAVSYSLLVSMLLALYLGVRHGPLEVLEHTQGKLMLFFLLLSAGALLHAYVQTHALKVFEAQVGYFILFFNSYYMFTDTRRLRFFAWFTVIVHAYLATINADNYFAQVRAAEYLGGYFLRDGNDYAWAMVVAFPFAMYLLTSSKGLVKRATALSGLVAIGVAIMGTQSRGASLALVGMLLYYIFRISRRKAAGLALLAIAGVAAVVYAPDRYFDRLETLAHYEEDSSAVGRLNAWAASIEMAVDHPLLGVGAGNFNSAYGRFYRPEDANSNKWISAHSIYFLVLGEYGFVGISVLLAVILLNLKACRRAREILEQGGGPDGLPPSWPAYLAMSIVGYAIGGMFLGGVNYPHLFILTGLTLGTSVLVRTHGDSAAELDERLAATHKLREGH